MKNILIFTFLILYSFSAKAIISIEYEFGVIAGEFSALEYSINEFKKSECGHHLNFNINIQKIINQINSKLSPEQIFELQKTLSSPESIEKKIQIKRLHFETYDLLLSNKSNKDFACGVLFGSILKDIQKSETKWMRLQNYINTN